MVLSEIKNPFTVGSYGSFEIKVYDKYRELVAKVDQGVFFETTAGSIIDVEMELSDTIVTRYSPLTLRFAPLHRVHGGDSRLKIEVQRDIEISCP